MDFTEAYDETCSYIGLLARYGKYRLLKKSLLQGRTFEACDNRGWLPIHEAAANGKFLCLRILFLKDKNQINELTFDGHTPIHLAIKNGHLKCVRWLLFHGANINIPNDEDKHPFKTAIINNHTSIVNLLLQHNYADKSILSACLLDAIEIGNESLSILLMNNGCDLNAQDEFGRNAIFIAAEKGYFNILKCLLTKTNFKKDIINFQTFDGATPLFIATQNGKKECLDLLLKHGGDPNICCKDLSLPLHIACEKGYVDCISSLTPPITKINSWEDKGVNVFALSIGHHKIDSVLALLKFTKNIDDLFDKSWLIDAEAYVAEFKLSTLTMKVPTYFSIISFAVYTQTWDILNVLLPYSNKIFCQENYFNCDKRVINIASAMLLSPYQLNIQQIYTLLWTILNKSVDKNTLKQQFSIDPLYIDIMMDYHSDFMVLLEFIKLNLVDPEQNLLNFSRKDMPISINTFVKHILHPILAEQMPHQYLDRLISLNFKFLQYTANVIPPQTAKRLKEKYHMNFNIYTGPRSLKHLCRVAMRRQFRICYPQEPLEIVLSRFKILPEYLKNYISFAVD